MSLFKSNNPILKDNMYEGSVFEGMRVHSENAMTVKGTLNKFGMLMLLMVASSFFSWNYATQGNSIMPLILIALIGGLVCGFIMSRKPQTSTYMAPIYALLEGLFVGAISALYEYKVGAAGGYSGIVPQAIGLTLGVALAMYLLYTFKIITVTQRLRSIVLTACVGVGIFYLVVFIASLIFGNSAVPGFIYQPTLLGIGFSILMVALASFKLLIDFDNVEQGVQAGAPKYMEWYSAFGLLVTIVWLYIEMLRLLAKLSSRD
jgi:uncharacterized YccA/Bax inhibitor family protein